MRWSRGCVCDVFIITLSGSLACTRTRRQRSISPGVSQSKKRKIHQTNVGKTGLSWWIRIERHLCSSFSHWRLIHWWIQCCSGATIFGGVKWEGPLSWPLFFGTKPRIGIRSCFISFLPLFLVEFIMWTPDFVALVISTPMSFVLFRNKSGNGKTRGWNWLSAVKRGDHKKKKYIRKYSKVSPDLQSIPHQQTHHSNCRHKLEAKVFFIVCYFWFWIVLFYLYSLNLDLSIFSVYLSVSLSVSSCPFFLFLCLFSFFLTLGGSKTNHRKKSNRGKHKGNTGTTGHTLFCVHAPLFLIVCLRCCASTGCRRCFLFVQLLLLY